MTKELLDFADWEFENFTPLMQAWWEEGKTCPYYDFAKSMYEEYVKRNGGYSVVVTGE